jgi:hypothetical protein
VSLDGIAKEQAESLEYLLAHACAASPPPPQQQQQPKPQVVLVGATLPQDQALEHYEGQVFIRIPPGCYNSLKMSAVTFLHRLFRCMHNWNAAELARGNMGERVLIREDVAESGGRHWR